jgi:hypothetical protein
LRAQLQVPLDSINTLAKLVNLNGVVDFLDIVTNRRYGGCKVCFYGLKPSTYFVVKGV